jgi:hypothetical protein
VDSELVILGQARRLVVPGTRWLNLSSPENTYRVRTAIMMVMAC